VRKRVLSGVLIAALVVLAGLWFSDTLRIPTDGPSFAGGVVVKAQGSTSDPGQPQSTEPGHRDLSSAQPLRLWIGGDSLAGSLGPALGEMTAATGVVQPQYDYRVGSGLMSGDIDWLQRGQEQMDEVNPEVAVFIIGTNDARVYTDRDAATYEQLTEKMMRTLAGNGREVYWVNAPVMRDGDLDENVVKVDAIQRRVADRVPGVTFVDAHTLFADEKGEYQSSLPDETGDNVTMRAGDGIHLTGDGAHHLALAIYALLDPNWRISEQQVVGQTKKVIVSEDSDAAYGSGGNGGSGSGSGSNGSNGSSNSNRSWSSNGSSSGSSSGGGTASGTTPTSAPAAPPPDPPTTQPTVVSTTPTTAATTPPSSSP
jgi:lysophospholipase L1-like esterase